MRLIAAAMASLSDPSPTSPIVAAAGWIEDAALGSVAVAVATIAIGVVGLMMLAGRLPIRRGATAVLGAFIVFGAPLIASGIMTILGAGGGISRSASLPPAPVETPPTIPPPPTQPQVYDPYAGASVPVR